MDRETDTNGDGSGLVGSRETHFLPQLGHLFTLESPLASCRAVLAASLKEGLLA